MPIFIANWKSNKTTQDAEAFIREFVDATSADLFDKNVIVICPPFTLLSFCSQFIRANDLNIHLGTQNISPFPTGAYTGEIAATQAKEFAEYGIIGHSERRTLLHETDEEIVKKVEQARNAGLMVVFCIQNELTPVPEGVDYIAYEPPSAIGSGNPDTPEHIGEVFEQLHLKNKSEKLLYGGSLKPENIHDFTSVPSIEGFLVGGASLDAGSFAQLVQRFTK